MIKEIHRICNNCNNKFSYHPQDRSNYNRTFCSNSCSRAWQSNNLSKVPPVAGQLQCRDCYQYKDSSEFSFKSKRKTSTWCKACFYIYQMKRWNSRKIKAIQYLGGKCVDCGLIDHPIVYDFDHRDPATKLIDWAGMRSLSWNKIISELDKCDLVCSMCHRKRHINHKLWPV